MPSRRARLRILNRQLNHRALFSVGALVLACAVGLGSIGVAQQSQGGAPRAAGITVRQQPGPALGQQSTGRTTAVSKAEVLRPAELTRPADWASPLGVQRPSEAVGEASLALPTVARERGAREVIRGNDTAVTTGTAEAAATPKAVVIVGPSGELRDNLQRAEEFASLAESYGMDVRRVFHPHATWANVLDNIQGAALVAYLGHGNSWPSPYGPFQERTKDGFGLDRRDGGSAHDVRYYGADAIRRHVVLAPNAVVVLNHLCYASGNAEPGMPTPDWETARQRVDNYASGFLAVGARAVFAYGTGSINPILDGLFTTDQTMDEIFMTRGAHRQPYYGFTGWDDRYYDSTRTPGLHNHLDPGASEGFLRALSGDLSMTTLDWLSGIQATSVATAAMEARSRGPAKSH